MAYKEDTINLTTSKVEQPFTAEALGFVPGHLFITVESANMRFWYGGKIPTSGEGHIGFANISYTFYKRQEIENLRMISQSGTSVVRYTVSGL